MRPWWQDLWHLQEGKEILNASSIGLYRIGCHPQAYLGLDLSPSHAVPGDSRIAIPTDIFEIHHLAHSTLIVSLPGQRRAVDHAFEASYHDFIVQVTNTNLVFSEWGQIFTDPLTTPAAIDKAVHHGLIIDFGRDIKSFRAQEAARRMGIRLDGSCHRCPFLIVA